jgi:hypothetical protein
MPKYLVDLSFWQTIWPLFLCPLFISIILTLLVVGTGRARLFRNVFISVLAFSMIGIVVGNITGISRVAIVGAVIPAVLALIGGVAAYLVGTGGRIRQMHVSLAVISMFSNLIVGTYWGSTTRTRFENNQSAALSSGISKEDVNFAIALQHLSNELKFRKIKNAIEKQESISLRTEYGVGGRTNEQPLTVGP